MAAKWKEKLKMCACKLSSDLKVPIMRLVYNNKKPRLLYEFFFFSIYNGLKDLQHKVHVRRRTAKSLFQSCPR